MANYVSILFDMLNFYILLYPSDVVYPIYVVYPMYFIIY